MAFAIPTKRSIIKSGFRLLFASCKLLVTSYWLPETRNFYPVTVTSPMAKEIKWYKLADHINMLPFEPNNMCVVEANGKKMTIAKHNGILYGFAYKCPHASGIMAEGFINALGQVVCPLHRYTFNMQNGRNVSGEGYYLPTYLVEERTDGVYVGMEKKGIFG